MDFEEFDKWVCAVFEDILLLAMKYTLCWISWLSLFIYMDFVDFDTQ